MDRSANATVFAYLFCLGHCLWPLHTTPSVGSSCFLRDLPKVIWIQCLRRSNESWYTLASLTTHSFFTNLFYYSLITHSLDVPKPAEYLFILTVTFLPCEIDKPTLYWRPNFFFFNGKGQGKRAFVSPDGKWLPPPTTPCNTRGATGALPAFTLKAKGLGAGARHYLMRIAVA